MNVTRLILLLLLVPCTAPVAFGQAEAMAPAPASTWIPLFNGKDLSGWTPKITGFPAGTNFASTFRVENGVLKVSYLGYTNFDGHFGHLFWKDRLTNYIVRVEYRFVGDQAPGGPAWGFRNSGVMLHSEPPESMELNQEFPTSIEAQLLGGTNSGARPTLGVCTPGTHVVIDGQLIRQHCTNSKAKTYDGDQWVTVEIEVHGSRRILHKIDGETVMEYSQPQYDDSDLHARQLIPADGDRVISSGYICIQAESHPVEFRRIDLLQLDR